LSSDLFTWTGLAAELACARAAAAAGAAVLASPEAGWQVREKGRADLVTDVDEAAERAVLKVIHQHFPDDRVLAEESGGEGEGAGRRWVVDPLDGTINFVHGHPFTCVSVALVDADGPAVATVRAPHLAEEYWAVRGGGAFLNDRPLRVSGVVRPEQALIGTGFPFRPGKGNVEPFLRLVSELIGTTHGVRRAGSAALDLAFVAAGRLDAFFELGLKPWDVAAGILLVREAGGTVGGWPGETEAPEWSGRVLASNGAIHPWLEELSGRYLPEL
jgi:myo-inositol-1(or 4)-monophosphatase